MHEKEKRAANERWAALLKKTITECVDKNDRPVQPVLFKMLVVSKLKEAHLQVTAGDYDAWLGGAKCPDHDTHKELLKILSGYGMKEERRKQLEIARVNIIHTATPPKPPKARPASTHFDNDHVYLRQDHRDPLRHLRVDQTDNPYEYMQSADWKRIFAGTKSAAEYIHCYRLEYYGREPSNAEARSGIPGATFSN